MTVTTKALQWLVPVVIAGSIVIGMVTGTWVTESSKVPVTYEEGEFAGVANPADIRGSYSMQDVADAFGVPVTVLLEAFDLPADETTALIKEFEDRFGFIGEWEIGTDAMRLFVARYLGLPFEPESTTGMLPTAFAIIEAQGSLPPDALEALETRVVAVDGGLSAKGEAPAQSQALVENDAFPTNMAPVPEAEEDYIIRGRTTFGEILAWGVPKHEIETAIGGEIIDRTAVIREYAIAEGLAFSDIKDQLQEIIDRYMAER